MPSGVGFRFGPFRLDPQGRRLLRDDDVMALQPLLADLLLALVSRPGVLLTKDELIKVGWPTHSVADNNLAQAISRIRVVLDANEPERYIQTVIRRGYRFIAPVTQDGHGLSDAELDEMMAPHVALLDGRAMLETLESDRIDRAIALFTQLVERDSSNALHHIGLANAYVLHFEATHSAAAPDVDALRKAVVHSREARRLAPALGEAWATYGFVIDRTGDRRAALGALIQATTLEPDNWAHHLRLAWCSWGERRLRAARRTLELRRGLAAAHWLIATVYAARSELVLAERELDAALAAMTASSGSGFSGAAVYWLKGLLCLARGAEDEAMIFFDRELALEPRRHLYGRECCASAWYAKGGVHMRRDALDAAQAAFAETLSRVPGHVMARMGMQIVDSRRGHIEATNITADIAAAQRGDSLSPESGNGAGDAPPMSIDRAMACAARLAFSGNAADGASLLTSALAAAAPGNAGWLLPIDPLLDVQRHPEVWTTAVTVLHERTFVWLKFEE